MQNLTPYDVERYKRHLNLDNFSAQQQIKLKNSKVLCVGAGGLGSPYLMYLAACGIGHIGILDMDTVELHNLQRQIIHLENNIGQSKVISAQTLLQQMHHKINISTYDISITNPAAENLFLKYDLIAVCVDNLEARYKINELAIKYRKPQISALVVGYDGALTCFKPYIPNAPCYECLQPKTQQNCVKTANDKGVLSPLVGVLGCAMVIETLRELLSWPNSLNGYMKYISVFDHTTHLVKLNKKPNCICNIKKD